MFIVNTKTSLIHITRGDSGTLSVELKDADGQAYVPQLGDRIIFRVADSSGTILLAKEGDIDNDSILITFLPEDTKDIQAGQYHYEVELVTDTDDHYTVIEYSIFEIGREIEQ